MHYIGEQEAQLSLRDRASMMSVEIWYKRSKNFDKRPNRRQKFCFGVDIIAKQSTVGCHDLVNCELVHRSAYVNVWIGHFSITDPRR